MNLVILNEDKAIEKGPKEGATKRKMTEKQLANLAAGRAVRAKMKVDRLALEATKVKPAAVPAAAPAAVPVAELPEPVVRRKRAKQVIVFDDDSESEPEAPQIIIKQKRTQKALPPPPAPPSPPPPIPKLRRV